MSKHKACAHCGHDNMQLYIRPTSGVGGVPRVRVVCPDCGLVGEFYDAFVNARDQAHAEEKAWKFWDMRSRERRSEDLVELIATLRSLLKDVAKGTKAKTVAAKHAHACCKQLQEEIEKILPLAKKGGEVVVHEVNRKLR